MFWRKKEIKNVKVTFRYLSNIRDEWVVETMWASVINEKKGIYELNNIPFYGAPVAPGDRFFAEFDNEENSLTYRELRETSDNSVVAVIIMKGDTDYNTITDEFHKLKCNTEGLNQKYFVMEVPRNVNYIKVLKKLSEYQEASSIDYSEPVLSEKHKKDLT